MDALQAAATELSAGTPTRAAGGIVTAPDRADAEALVATVVALALLRTRLAAQTSLWGPLVRKSEEWMTARLAAAVVTVGGQPLEEWAMDVVQGRAPGS